MLTAHFTGTSGTPDSSTSYYMGGQYEVKDGATKKYYSIAGMVVAVNDGTGLQYLLTDHLGSTVAVTNQSGTLTSQQRYLPFGAPRTIPNSPILGTDFTYTGQRKFAPADGMGSIMDYRARFYSPALGRFLQPDSIIPDQSNPQSWNRFSYVLNSPLRFNDPTGHWECDLDPDECEFLEKTKKKTAPPIPPGGGDPGNNNPEGELHNKPADNPCDNPNRSVILVCEEGDEYLGTYRAVTNTAYPIFQANIKDRRVAEPTGVPWMDFLLVLHDLVAIPVGSDWIARYVTKENAFATVKYDVYEGEYGKYPLVTEFTVVNLTNSPISVEGFSSELYKGEPNANIFIQPSAMTTVTIEPSPIMASSITIYLSDGMALSVTILP